jgi:hypothetical protein
MVEEETKGGKIVRDKYARRRLIHRGRKTWRHTGYTKNKV